MRHVFLAARQTPILEKAAYVTLITIVRSLGAARSSCDVSRLTVAVSERTLEVVEESLLYRTGQRVGAVAVDVGHVDDLLAPALSVSRSASGSERPVENATIAICHDLPSHDLWPHERKIGVEWIRKRLGVESLERPD